MYPVKDGVGMVCQDQIFPLHPLLGAKVVKLLASSLNLSGIRFDSQYDLNVNLNRPFSY